jgi:hypothetical protein
VAARGPPHRARHLFRPDIWQLRQRPTRPIHIVVENGHVTLTGVVASEFDRRVAGMRARQFPSFSVTNHLKTDEEMKAALERM